MIPRLLAQVGLEPRVARMYPHELSGGMKQRVLMAIAVALEPDLVIADEPTTALDVTIQRVILQTLADLRTDFGVTLMVISHDMGVHAQLADRVAVMYDGRAGRGRRRTSGLQESAARLHPAVDRVDPTTRDGGRRDVGR